MGKSVTSKKELIQKPEGLKKQEENAAVARAEDYLGRYSRLNQRIDQKLRFLDQLRAMATRTTGDPFALPTGGGEDSRAASVQRMVDVEREIDCDIDHLQNLRNEIWDIFSQLKEPKQALILEDAYLEKYPAQKVADRADRSKRHMYRLRRGALLEVDRILQEERPMRGYVSPL